MCYPGRKSMPPQLAPGFFESKEFLALYAIPPAEIPSVLVRYLGAKSYRKTVLARHLLIGAGKRAGLLCRC